MTTATLPMVEQTSELNQRIDQRQSQLRITVDFLQDAITRLEIVKMKIRENAEKEEVEKIAEEADTHIRCADNTMSDMYERYLEDQATIRDVYLGRN